MVRLYLVRHGWTAWHTEQRVAGRSDVPLDARGEAEAQAAGNWLAARIDGSSTVIVSSPVMRARQTAERIAGCLQPQKQVVLDDGLAETLVGRWEGMLVGDIQNHDPQWPAFFQSPAHFRFPGGELLEDVRLRAVAAVDALMGTEGRRAAIIVAHADTLRCIIAHYLGLSLDYAYRMRLACGSISRLSVPLENVNEPGNWPHLDFLNMTDHLPISRQGVSA